MGGSAKPTINDVARIAEVSKKTVSRVINKSPLLSAKTRDHVEQVIRELGYVPNPQARALALRRNFIIAAIHDNPNAQFLVNVQKGILAGIEDTDFGLMVKPVNRGSPDILDDIRAFLENQRPYGVVLLPPISEDEQIARLCEELGCRYVRMTSVELNDPEHTVRSNDREAVRGAVDYLISKGHRDIALIEGPAGFGSAMERKAGYDQAMAAAGLTVAPWMVVQGTYTFDSGIAAGLSLIDGVRRPTAIFASNDEMAIGAMIAARRRGIDIPGELSIVGFDDTPLSSHSWPALTTVRWPIAEMGHRAARRLIAAEDDVVPADTPLPSTLIERDSVAAPVGGS